MSHRGTWLASAALCAASAVASAQQLEPRAYAPIPVGVNVVGMPFVYQTGAVITDPSLPVQNVDAKVEVLAAFYDRTFSFFGRSASALVAIPYVWAKVTGDVFEERRTVTRSGQGDMQLRFASNILGAPALTPAEFAHTRQGPSLGASITVLAPIGQYYGDKLINIGTNRWSFKPELGFYWPIDRWTLEIYSGVWLYTANDDFFGGHRRVQDPLVSLQGHISYTFCPGLWLAVDGTWYSGGQTRVDGVWNDDRQQNSRIGSTLAVPIGQHHGLKFAWAKGATTRLGQDFTTLGLTYQYHWF